MADHLVTTPSPASRAGRAASPCSSGGLVAVGHPLAEHGRAACRPRPEPAAAGLPRAEVGEAHATPRAPRRSRPRRTSSRPPWPGSTSTARGCSRARRSRQGYTREEWRSGEIPVVPYPVAQARWKLDYTYADAVGLQVLLFPKAGSGMRPNLFLMELKPTGDPAHRRWVVDSWTPSGVANPALQAPRRPGPRGRRRRRARRSVARSRTSSATPRAGSGRPGSSSRSRCSGSSRSCWRSSASAAGAARAAPSARTASTPSAGRARRPDRRRSAATSPPTGAGGGWRGWAAGAWSRP